MKCIVFKDSKYPYLLLVLGMIFSLNLVQAVEPDSLELDKPQRVLKQDSLLLPDLEGYVPSLHSEMIKDRLACIQGDIKMTYHGDVMNWIKFYTVKNRDYTQRILDRSTFFFPIFEEALKRHNMPEELKYLSIVESALEPKAASWAAAVGLWQFIPSTGKEYGLHQDWFIDERMDLYKSTDAACRYLKFLYKYHGDWQLALAAYNCGPGRVNWAVRKAGGKGADFWKIYNYLPRETRSYVPAFIGATYAMNFSKDHFIFPKNPRVFIPSDTIHINQFLNIEEFAKQIEVPVEQMELLNPHLKKKAIPAYKKNYPLRFPADKRGLIDSNRVAILKASNRASRRELPYTAGNQRYTSSTEGKTAVYHRVSSGQSINFIALKYGVSANSLRVWNQLRGNLIHPGQRLVLWIPTKKTTTKKASNQNSVKTSSNSPTKSKPSLSGDLKYHTVQSGDTLWDIAQKYPGLSVAQLRTFNSLSRSYMLKPGQKLIIGNK